MVLCLVTLTDLQTHRAGLSASAELLVFTGQMHFLSPNQQCQNIEGNILYTLCTEILPKHSKQQNLSRTTMNAHSFTATQILCTNIQIHMVATLHFKSKFLWLKLADYDAVHRDTVNISLQQTWHFMVKLVNSLHSAVESVILQSPITLSVGAVNAQNSSLHGKCRKKNSHTFCNFSHCCRCCQHYVANIIKAKSKHST